MLIENFEKDDKNFRRNERKSQRWELTTLAFNKRKIEKKKPPNGGFLRLNNLTVSLHAELFSDRF